MDRGRRRRPESSCAAAQKSSSAHLRPVEDEALQSNPFLPTSSCSRDGASDGGAPPRRSHPPRQAPVSIPDAINRSSGLPSKSTSRPPLHPRRLAPYTDAEADADTDTIDDLFESASPICPEFSWTTMMSEDIDVEDISLSTPLHDLGTQTRAAKAKRADNYTLQEDIQLCMSWENTNLHTLQPGSEVGQLLMHRR